MPRAFGAAPLFLGKQTKGWQGSPQIQRQGSNYGRSAEPNDLMASIVGKELPEGGREGRETLLDGQKAVV